MGIRPDGRAVVRLSKSSTDIMQGDASNWTDEELLQGQRRSKAGHWTGVRPKVVPMAVHQELIRRRYFEGEAEIREAVLPAAQYIAAVVKGEQEANPGRLKACEIVLERFFGKPRQFVALDVTQTEAPWQKALNLAIVGTAEQAAARNDEDEIVDAEIVIDPMEDIIDPWDDPLPEDAPVGQHLQTIDRVDQGQRPTGWSDAGQRPIEWTPYQPPPRRRGE